MITATRKHKRKASFINMYSKREKPMVAGERNKYPDYPRSAPNFQSNAERTKKATPRICYITANQTPKCRFLKLSWHKLFRDFFFLFLASLLWQRDDQMRQQLCMIRKNFLSLQSSWLYKRSSGSFAVVTTIFELYPSKEKRGTSADSKTDQTLDREFEGE